MAILVSGGAGYIGSHTCIELLNAGYDVVVADNYYNASPVVLDRVKQITGKDFRFYNADMTKHEKTIKYLLSTPVLLPQRSPCLKEKRKFFPEISAMMQKN